MLSLLNRNFQSEKTTGILNFFAVLPECCFCMPDPYQAASPCSYHRKVISHSDGHSIFKEHRRKYPLTYLELRCGLYPHFYKKYCLSNTIGDKAKPWQDNLHYEKFGDGTVKCIEGEIPFELPKGWAWARLLSISTMSNGTAKRRGSDGALTTVLRLADLDETEISFSDTRSVILTENEINKYALSAGDVLFIRVNGSKENVGKSYYFEGGSLPVAYCDHLIRCTPTIVWSGKLLSIFMRCGYVRQLVSEHMVSAAGQNTISQPSLGTILLPIPPLYEQNRIIQRFEETDSFIAQISNSKHELSEIIEHTKSKILDLAIRGKLVPQDPNDESASVLLERIQSEKKNSSSRAKLSVIRRNPSSSKVRITLIMRRWKIRLKT